MTTSTKYAKYNKNWTFSSVMVTRLKTFCSVFIKQTFCIPEFLTLCFIFSLLL